MGKLKDLTGRGYGRLTVIERRGSDKYGNAMWLCKCECGNEVIVRGSHLISDSTTSCGCYRKEKTKELWQNEEFRKIQSEKTKEKWQNEEFRQIQSEASSKRLKERWQDEEFRQMRINEAKERTGENNANYKGGITPIRKYLRLLPVVVKWMEDAKENVNYTCELIGKQCYVETHHIKPFCELNIEAHMLNGIQI